MKNVYISFCCIWIEFDRSPVQQLHRFPDLDGQKVKETNSELEPANWSFRTTASPSPETSLSSAGLGSNFNHFDDKEAGNISIQRGKDNLQWRNLVDMLFLFKLVACHTMDGCREFIPSLTATPTEPPTSLKCAAYGCHWIFHQRKQEKTNTS